MFKLHGERSNRCARRKNWRNFCGNIWWNTTIIITPEKFSIVFSSAIAEGILARIIRSNNAKLPGDLAGLNGRIPAAIPEDIPPDIFNGITKEIDEEISGKVRGKICVQIPGRTIGMFSEKKTPL